MNWWLILFGALVGPAVSLPAYAADPIPNQSQVRQDWFKSLRSPQGTYCCDVSDGYRIGSDEAKQVGSQWFVFHNGAWIPVPEDRIVRKPSIDGEAYLFPRMYPPDSPDPIRCFVPPVPGY